MSATIASPSETEAGSAGKQPCRGITWRAHPDDEPEAGRGQPRPAKTDIGGIDPPYLENPTYQHRKCLRSKRESSGKNKNAVRIGHPFLWRGKGGRPTSRVSEARAGAPTFAGIDGVCGVLWFPTLNAKCVFRLGHTFSCRLAPGSSCFRRCENPDPGASIFVQDQEDKDLGAGSRGSLH